MTLPATTPNNLVAGKVVAPVVNKQVQNAPKMLNPDRGRNFQTAAADRQAVFKGDCVRCHVTPGEGKLGKALYDASCGICHDSHNRATMVPDLLALKMPTDKDFWRAWITYGRPSSLMPAFAQAEGGPLTEEQIASLVTYLTTAIPSRPNEFE
jgi:mono/diheme cytochrome c family protein